MMQWERLLSLKRQGDTEPRIRKEQDQNRLGFEVDFDRIIFSAPFRTLQDKTQVIPLSKTNFVHSRLTHSLEVSVVGRSLGRSIGKIVLDKYPYLAEMGYESNDFGVIVAAAALAHDIGNPPFGHSGEKAIGEYFLTGNGRKYKEKLSPKEFQDLASFEGNANGITVLSSSMFGVEGGLRISYATLGAFMKYPKESLPVKPTNRIADKKFGFFQADKSFIEDVAHELGLIPNKSGNDIGFERHPLAYLVEAADDICYTIIDFEDGINLGWIDEDYALEYLIKLVKDNIRPKYYRLKSKEDRVSYLRALAISRMIDEVIEVFRENETQILSGNFPHSLTDKSRFKAQMDDIIQICAKKIYQSQEVTEKEITGYRVLTVLLDAFTTAYNNHYEGKASSYDKLILRLLPERYRAEEVDSLYERLLQICHFISLLTDGNALQLSQIIQAGKVNS